MISLSWLKIPHYTIIALVLLTAGLLSDILDGIIARKLGIATDKLRRQDSNVDQVFYIGYAIATYLECPDFFSRHWLQLLTLGIVEGMAYLICFIKFKKEIATHTYGAKLWSLFIFAALIQITLQCDSTWIFAVFFWLGLITRIEIISIILLLKKYTIDIPSVFHAFRLINGTDQKKDG
jgi:CDP-diacylglycerol--glycerol-3-phosphate 3-phosphatidyltransferase